MSVLEEYGNTTVGEIGHNIEIEWKIPDFFSLLKEDSKWYYSPQGIFSFEDSSFFMRIQQSRGVYSTEDKYIDVSVSIGNSDLDENDINVSFALKTSNGCKDNEKHFTRFSGKYDLECEILHFISKTELLRRKYELVPASVLTIICTITKPKSFSSANNKTPNILCPHCKMTLDDESIQSHEFYCMVKCPKCGDDVILQLWYEHDCRETNAKVACSNQTGLVFSVNHLLEKKKGTDVTFELETLSGETRIPAHQLILAARSPYFEDKFFSEQRNKEHHIIPLTGINSKAFEQMIRYCYGYEPDLEDIKEVCFLFKIASEFKVKSLIDLCYSLIKVEPNNVFSILEVLEQADTNVEILKQEHKDMCYDILQEKTEEVLGSYKLCEITPNMIDIVLNLPKLSLGSEYELITWLFDWAKIKSSDDPVCKNSREYLHKFLPSMNFLSLTFEEFAMLCRDNSDFFSSDEMASIYQNIACPRTREMPHWYGKDIKDRVYTGLKE